MTAQKALFWDIETASVDLLWSLPPEKMFRIGGYAWGRDGKPQRTTDLEEMRHVIRSADIVVGHNIHAFDLNVVFGKDSTEPLEMALENRIWDTWTHATLVHPAPDSYVGRDGVTRYVTSPEQAMPWFSLDQQAYQLGVAGKSADLKALAAKYGGYDQIPLDDPEYLQYLDDDVLATRAVAERLLRLGGDRAYIERENINAAIDAQNSRNGWRVDVERAKARVAELDAERDRYLEFLEREYGFPTGGKAPLRTNEGKAAITRALNDVGISLDDLPRTKKNGKPTSKPSFGGKGLVKAAEGKGEAAEKLTAAIAAIGGMRPLAQSALNAVQPDGKVHVNITTLQRSGRKSTTNPGLTVWTSRGTGAVEKSYFIADPGYKIVEFDYSQADARIVAAYSGDEEFAKRFAPGVDAHLLTAQIVWGEDVVGHDKSDPTTAYYRQKAKAQNHAYSYNAGPKTLAENAGVPLADSERFVAQMKAAYRQVEKWKNRTIKEGRRGSVVSDWGRRMMVTKDKEFTQAPALYGQNGTREIVVDGLIRMARADIRSITFLLAQVHDALVFQLPVDELDYWINFIRTNMQTSWGPSDGSGMVVDFPVDGGKPADNWQDAGH